MMHYWVYELSEVWDYSEIGNGELGKFWVVESFNYWIGDVLNRWYVETLNFLTVETLIPIARDKICWRV